MDNQFKETFGSWTQAIGTVISAVGGTPSKVFDEDFRKNLDLIGNELQATGNAILADAEETWSLDKFGNQIQAIGNSTVILGLVIDFDEVTKQELIIKGNLIQALGGGTAVAGAYENPDEPEQALNVTGNILQAIGNSMQAIGGISELRNSILEKDQENDEGEKQENDEGKQEENEEGKQKYQYPDLDEKQTDAELIQTMGGWIQAVGSVLNLIGQLRSNNESQSGQDSSNESHSDQQQV